MYLVELIISNLSADEIFKRKFFFLYCVRPSQSNDYTSHFNLRIDLAKNRSCISLAFGGKVTGSGADFMKGLRLRHWLKSKPFGSAKSLSQMVETTVVFCVM